ncbi:hypothetical protein [uncultured Jannaschia sp.]|uniref:hypothetical protein n=1 Tax=uncultured Jannaschia sp. TaxID=293347 RepID=UPI00262C8BA1|nr:hypothetical protein [uncultured Jannaschia sp.]
MANGNLLRHIGMIAIVAAILAASVYLAMVSVTLAHLEIVSELAPFDMRPLGYSPIEAASLIDGLGIAGRKYYLTRQIPLDMLYPALLALTLSSTIIWFGKHMPNRRIIHFGVALSVGIALFDYIENFGIVAMILSWPDVSGPLVYATSTATIAKSTITTAAVILVLLTGLIWCRLPRADARA